MAATPDLEPDIGVEARIRIAQIRLIHANIGNSTLPTIAVALVLLVVLWGHRPAAELGVWLALIIANKTLQVVEARRAAGRDIPPRRIAAEIGRLMVLHAADAALWSALGWLVLGRAPVMPTMLVMAVLSGVISGAASMLAPVLAVFAAYFFAGIVVLDARFAVLRDPQFWPLAAIVNLYVSSMWLQARANYQTSRESIRLRFENVALMRDLEAEVARSRAAQQAALEANLAKSRFLAAASHDLRQPVHALSLFLEALAVTVRGAKALNLTDRARQAAASSAEMLNALLDFSRAEAGVLTPQPRPVSLTSILARVDVDFSPLAAEKGLRWRVAPTGLWVRTDPALVQMILHNLAANAVRYTQTGGVLIGARREGERVRIEVWDTGAGIAPADQAVIFDEFRQLGNPERDRRKGLGLGLATARRVAEDLQATIGLRSRPGQGSLFSFALPRAPPAGEIAARPPAPRRAPDRRGVRVLVVDDDESNRDAMSVVLRDAGFEVVLADGADQAYAQARLSPPDILVCDLRLRGPDGAEVIAGLRALTGAATPALLVTGETDSARLRQFKDWDFKVLHKPVQAPDLIGALDAELRAAREPDGASAAD